jgi:aminopeptidase N
VEGRLQLPTPEPIRRVDGPGGAVATGLRAHPRISSYITAIVAGPYEATFSELTSASGRVIPLGVYGRKSLWQHLDADYIFDKTREGFAYYEEKFGVPYPFAKYDQLFVPEFNAGAMENAGAVTFTETYVFRSKVTDAVKERRVVTILHELAHMWFGDLVTMKWWNDLWLNESFAEWASTIATAEATEWTEAWTTFNAMEKTWAYRQDQLPSTHPSSPRSTTSTTCRSTSTASPTPRADPSSSSSPPGWASRPSSPASRVLPEARVATPSSATCSSSSRPRAAATSRLVEEVARDRGRQHARAGHRRGRGRHHLALRRVQTAPADYPTIRPHRLGVGFYNLDAAARSCAPTTSRSTSTATAPRSRARRAEAPDLVLLNDEDLAYAKIRLDERSLATAVAHLADISDPLARSLVWGAAWDQTRDAESAASDYIDLVLGNIGRETESTTVRTTLASCRPPPRCTSCRSTGTLPHPRRRRPVGARPGRRGGQRQPAAVRHRLRELAHHSRARRRRPRLRDGVLTLEGLEIDTDLSWQLLVGSPRWAPSTAPRSMRRWRATTPPRAGSSPRRRGPRCRRPRTSGRVGVARRARRPVQHDRPLGGTRLHAPGRVALLEPFVAQYFDALLRSGRAHLPGRELPDRGPVPEGAREHRPARCDPRLALRPPGRRPALRRLVFENLADVERALAAQARDAESVEVVTADAQS